MALQSTTKIRLYTSAQKESEVLSFLQERGVMEVTPVDAEISRTDVCHSAEFASAKLDFAIRYLTPFAPAKKGMRNAVLGEKIEISEKEAQEKISGYDWEAITAKVSALESEKNDATREAFEIKTALSALEKFEGVDTESREGTFAPSFFVIPVKGASDFVEEVKNLSKFLEISEVARTESSISFIVFARVTEKNQIISFLSQYKGSEISLPVGKSPAQQISSLQDSLFAAEKTLEQNKKETESLVSEIDTLKVCYDQFASQKEVDDVRRGVEKTSFVSMIEGWVETEALVSVKKDLESRFGSVEIEEIEKGEKEKSPVALKNSAAVQPFEVVTNMYGTPGENEIDPTPFLAPFFVVFFGLCLTDAAYGMLLAVAMGALLAAKLPLDLGAKKMITLLFYAGLSTVFFGILFGGWFGIDPSASFVPEFLTYVNASGETMFLGQVVNPAKDLVAKIAPLVLLGGVIHLLLGVALKGYVAWKNNNKWDTIMVSIPTILTIVSGLLLAVASSGAILADSTELLKNITLVFFGIMTIGIMKSGGPITWFMDVTGWLSNTLSYARLFALGLATGVVAQVFNTVAFTIGEMMPAGVSIVVIIFILLFGHTLNIALNLLGAFVHSGRLQFVEFFGQFLDGGGKYFSPLKKVNRFIHKG